MVAFSGAAMANTGEVKEDVVLSNENKVEAAVTQGPGDNEGVATPCEDFAITIYEYVLATYNPGGEDLDLLNALIANCH